MKKRSEVRRHRVKVSVSDRERRRLRDLAKREGKGVAVLMHELMLEALDRRAPPEK